MENEKKELFEAFDKLDPENRAEVLAHVRIAYAAQESTRRRVLEMVNNSPEYADRHSAPMGGLKEAVNG